MENFPNYLKFEEKIEQILELYVITVVTQEVKEDLEFKQRVEVGSVIGKISQKLKHYSISVTKGKSNNKSQVIW